jgi:fatty-acyl-CoA synthase
VVLVDTAFLPLAEAALAMMEGPRPEIIEVPDPNRPAFPPPGGI